MKKKKDSTGKIRNRRASFDYELGDSFVVGIVLNGRETKNLRLGHGQLTGAYVNVRNDELWLTNATITGTNGIPIEENEITRERKLLAKKSEINKIIEAKNQGMTIIPTEILTNSRYIKVRIALGKGKKHYDKRQSLKKRDDERNKNRLLRNR